MAIQQKGGLRPPFLFALLLVAVAGSAAAADTTYEFSNWAGPALEIRLFVPDEARVDTPVVIVIHGWSRAAERYFDDWKKLGEEHGFVVAVPHFTVDGFPGANEFNQGHVFDTDTAEPRPPATWTLIDASPATTSDLPSITKVE